MLHSRDIYGDLVDLILALYSSIIVINGFEMFLFSCFFYFIFFFCKFILDTAES